MPRGDEKQWVDSLKPALAETLASLALPDATVKICSGYPLAYANEILRYSQDDVPTPHSADYETDLLIYDEFADGDWIPRVVIECKFGSVTTHDALTYSAKAATHKHVHPYLRYGILIGGFAIYPLPPRLVRHGAYFDFMAVMEGTELSTTEITELGEILRQEVLASRQLQGLLADRSAQRAVFRLLHRPLVLKKQE